MDLHTSTKPKLAVIGAGHLGRIHAKLLATRSDCTLVGVCDPIASSREWVEQNLQIASFSDFSELVDQVDAIVLATPTEHHHRVGKWALEQGIHTLIEKPIANRVDQARELHRCATKNQAILQVGNRCSFEFNLRACTTSKAAARVSTPDALPISELSWT
jgi:predicted dehydrogenase